MVDTGANVSVLKSEECSRGLTTDYKLYAANGSAIHTYGEKRITLDLGLRRPFTWTFILADVKTAIIGADFLEYHKLLVDMHGKRLIDEITKLPTPAVIVRANEPMSLSTIAVNIPQDVKALLNKYIEITRYTTLKHLPKHKVEHRIITNGAPVYCRARPLPPDRHNFAKKEFQSMMEQGICRPSDSQWASPLHMVRKKNGEWRPCGDYRALNKITVPDRYPLPRLLDFTYVTHGKTVFSKLDIRKAFHCIPVTEEDIAKTAIITPFGLFEFPRMTFGLRNAGQTFQRFMDSIFRDLNFAYIFVDDCLIASRSREEHLQHLEIIFKRLQQYEVTINIDKCEFFKAELDFLGYRIMSQGIKPTNEKVQAIIEYPKPETIKELRRFLGMMNFYRGNLAGAAGYQAELHKYLRCSKKNDNTPIVWTAEAEVAFGQCKEALRNAAILAFPAPGAPLALMTDASQKCVGAVLQQRMENKWQPIAYFSKALSEAQTRYSTFDRELLGIYMAIKHFRRLIEGREFTIFTDHRPLTYSFTKKPSLNDTPRRIRYLDFISQFSTDVRHISGSDNVVADALSRVIEEITMPTPLDFSELAKAQRNDPRLAELRRNIKLKIAKKRVGGTNVSVFCDVSTGKPRPYLPISFRREVFDSIHGLSHSGKRATRKLITQKYIWPRMNADINEWCQTCIQCQRAKVHRHTVSPFAEFSHAARFSHLHIDIVGPLPISQTKRYLITMIDRYTHWPEAFPVSEISAETVAKVVYGGWISRFGCPERITTDQGRQFESGVFQSLAKLLGIQKIRTTAYHPQSNGMVERWHRALKAALMAKNSGENWVKQLPSVLLGLRSCLRDDTGYSAAEMVYGTAVRLPGEFFEKRTSDMDYGDFVQGIRENISRLATVPKRKNTNGHIFVHPALATCTHVFIRCDMLRKSLVPPYDGPYRVVDRSEKYMQVKKGDKLVWVSIDRVKPAFLLERDICGKAISASNTDCPVPVITRSGRVSKPPVRFE